MLGDFHVERFVFKGLLLSGEGFRKPFRWSVTRQRVCERGII